MRPRYLEARIEADLARKMVFLGGPRQVGKTTLARRLLGRSVGYLNWDVPAHRARILSGELPSSSRWVFDELHKYRKWRNYLKGLYDGRREGQQILVTGSARLDLYRFGGDSLQGRYHYLRLHPLSVAELGDESPATFRQLMELGGFPEPFLGGDKREAKRWSREYRTRLIREDIVGLERIQDLGSLELLMLRLPHLVGSPLSINALVGDLQVSHKTIAHWVTILENMYAVFRLPPFGAPRIRAVKHEQKHYHLDWSLVPEAGPRFENLVACHLLKWVHFREDTEGDDVELRYFRDTDGREVDFVVTLDRKPVLFVECKHREEAPTRGLSYLKGKFPNVETWQVYAEGKKDYVTPNGIRVAHAAELMKKLV